MSSLTDLARLHTQLDEPAISHLRRLAGSWGLLADLSFSDLLLFAPTELRADVSNGRPSFVGIAQIRPSTTQTLYESDAVGVLVTEAERPLVVRAFLSGQWEEGDVEIENLGDRTQVLTIPVRHEGRVIGVLSRENRPTVRPKTGALEEQYLKAFEQLARMVAAGIFPFANTELVGNDGPRVGDGLIILNEAGRVSYCTPNAISALHRIGVLTIPEGDRLILGGLHEEIVRPAFTAMRPVTEELDAGHEAFLLAHCVPLIERGEVVGGMLLLRDISEVKRLDRLLVSKDATIREIHHRVKNNLQTISSLLRLQGRRTGSEEAKVAFNESVRRIGAIALVHEILAREGGDDVPFVDIARPLLRTVEDSMVLPGRHIVFSLEGDSAGLPAEIATPLSVVLTELVQNAVDHAFPAEWDGDERRVHVSLRAEENTLTLVVRDNGVGMPPGKELREIAGLGLSIVGTLIQSELMGSLGLSADSGHDVGASIEVVVPADGIPSTQTHETLDSSTHGVSHS